MKKNNTINFQSWLRTNIETLISVGTKGYPQEVQRRLRIINVMTYWILIATVSYIILFSVLDFRTYLPLIIINSLIVVVVASVPFVHRFHELAGCLLLIVTEFAAFYFLTAYLGRPSGIQLQYIIGASLPFIIIGVHRLPLISNILLSAMVLHMAAFFMYNRHNAILQADKSTLFIVYINASVTTFIVTAVVIYYAVRLANQAEAEQDRLLRSILPEKIVERLKINPEKTISDHYDDATVIFIDLVGFTKLSKDLGSNRTTALLNKVFDRYDELALIYGVEKIKTIGDAYMAVTGVPTAQVDHCRRMGQFALRTRDAVLQMSEQEGVELKVRIGIASGPLMAGLIGQNKFAYDIWGDTVNLASRMESQGEVNRIQVNQMFKDRADGVFTYVSAGEKEMRGVGLTSSWFLEAES